MNLFGAGDQSDEDIKRSLIRQYFTPDKGPPPWVFASLGGLCVIALFVFLALGLPSYSSIVAAILAVVSFAVAWVSFNERAQRATDDDIDFWRDEDFDRIVAEVCEDAALNTADLIDPDDPIVIAGLPRFKHLKVSRSHDDGSGPQAWRFKVKVGRDGVTRVTPPCLSVLHFTKDHLIAYQCDLDLLSGRALNETIEEYFWQDIATLQIEKQSLAAADDEFALFQQWSQGMPGDVAEKYDPLFSGKTQVLPTGRRTTLRLKTNSGGGLEIVVADERFVDNPGEDSLQARNDQAIARLRKLLRDRKVKR
jgi:hypothetical protein